MFSWLTTELQVSEECLTHSRSQSILTGGMKLLYPGAGNRGLEMGQGLTQSHRVTQPDPVPGLCLPRCPHAHPHPPKAISLLCLPSCSGHSSLSLRRANSPQLFQLFLSNSLYNKLCLNFCLSDNNNNTIIIWSITYSQLYLIKAVISLRVSGNRVNRKSCTTRTPLWGLHLHGSGVTRAEAPEARGHRRGPAARVWVIPSWSHAEGGSAVASGQRLNLEPLRTRARIPSELSWLTGKSFLSRLWNRRSRSRKDTTWEQGRWLRRPEVQSVGQREGINASQGRTGRAWIQSATFFLVCLALHGWHYAGPWR